MSARQPIPRLPPFERVVDAHGASVWRFAASQVGTARADDVYQETMLAALSAYPTLRDPAAVRTWLLRIASRKAIDLFRADARGRVPAGIGDTELEESPPTSTPDGELWTHVRALPEKQRHALALRVLLDLPYVEVGAIMRTSPVAARRNVFEAISALRRVLPEQPLRAIGGP